MRNIQNMVFLCVTLMTCLRLPACDGQNFLNIFKPSYTPEYNFKMFEPLALDDHIPVEWSDSMVEPPLEKPCLDQVWKAQYKHLVKMLLDKARENPTDGLRYQGKLEIKLNLKNYNLLTEFASSDKEEDVSMLETMEDILNNSLSVSAPQIELIDTLLSCGILILLIVRKFFQADLSLGSMFLRLIFFGWIVDFCFCWFHLLQEAEINKMVTLQKFYSIPDNCDPKKLSYWGYIVGFFSSSDDCKEYFHAIHNNNFFSISPLVVFSHQVSTIIYTPARKIGEAFGSFSSGILGELPWGVNLVLLPVVLMFAAMVIIILLLFLTKKSLSISMLGIFKFSLGNDSDVVNKR